MPMRTLPKACVASAAIAGSLLLAPAAYASSPSISGDNGTVKIHDSKTGEDLKKNEPHVCTFYLDAFMFDSAQKAWWKIVEWTPTGTKDKVVKAGDTDLDAVGHRRTEDLTLPDGHYRLYWNFEGELGAAKHKMFWVDCQDEGTPGTPGPSDSPSTSATPTGSATPSATPSAGDNGGAQPTGSASPSGAAAGGDTSGTGGDSGGNLAETGASVGGIAFAGALLLAAGGALFMRRRKSA